MSNARYHNVKRAQRLEAKQAKAARKAAKRDAKKEQKQ